MPASNRAKILCAHYFQQVLIYTFYRGTIAAIFNTYYNAKYKHYTRDFSKAKKSFFVLRWAEAPFPRIQTLKKHF